MGNVVDTLIPDCVQVKVGDRNYNVGKLTVSQVIKLTRHIAKFASEITAKTAKELKESKSNVDDILSFLGSIDEDIITEVIGIIIKEKDTGFLEKNLNIENTTEIIAAVCEKTDIKKILGNVERIAEAIKK